jgi:hypothetical protein
MRYYFDRNDPVVKFLVGIFKIGMFFMLIMLVISGVMDYFDLF